MSGRLYKRVCRLRAYRGTPNGYFTREARVLEISDLRIQFSIEKHLDREPNSATVTITNGARNTRAFFEHRPMIVEIEAGYDGALKHLFTGDLRYGSSSQDGPDWNTELQLGDGHRAYSEARVNQSFAPATPAATVTKHVVGAMGASFDSIPGASAIEADLQRQFATGTVVRGPARDQLTQLLTPYGYRWSFQNGKLVILKDEQTLPNTAWIISEANGMIGSPRVSAPENDGAPPKVAVDSLLYPEILPGGVARIDARFVRGLYKVLRVTHAGDTHGDEWTSALEVGPNVTYSNASPAT